jgi:hypothetical protein
VKTDTKVRLGALVGLIALYNSVVLGKVGTALVVGAIILLVASFLLDPGD